MTGANWFFGIFGAYLGGFAMLVYHICIRAPWLKREEKLTEERRELTDRVDALERGKS